MEPVQDSKQPKKNPRKKVFRFLSRAYSRGTEIKSQETTTLEPSLRVWEIKHLDEVPVVMNRLLVDLKFHPLEFLTVEPIIDEDEGATYWTLAGILVRSENIAILVWLDEIGKMPQSIRQILVDPKLRKFSHNLTVLDYLLIEEHGIYICEAYSPSATEDGGVDQRHYRGDEEKQKPSTKVAKATASSSNIAGGSDGGEKHQQKKLPNQRRLVQDVRFQSSASLIQYARSKKVASQTSDAAL